MLPIFLLLHYALAVLLLAGWLTDRGVAAWFGVGTGFAPVRWLAMGLLAVQTAMVVVALAVPLTPWGMLKPLPDAKVAETQVGPGTRVFLSPGGAPVPSRRRS